MKKLKFVAIIGCILIAGAVNAAPLCTLNIVAGPTQSQDQVILYSGSAVLQLYTMIIGDGSGYGKSASTDDICVNAIKMLKGIEGFKGAQGMCMPNWDQIQKEVASYSQKYSSSNNWRNLAKCSAQIATQIKQ